MQKMEWKQSVMSPSASFLFHIGRLTSSALSCSHNIPTVITCIAGHFNCLLGKSKSVCMAGSYLAMSAVSSRACKLCLRDIQQSVGLISVQNEVAYEYFGDRFSVTAERKYTQVSCLYSCQTSA